LDPGGSSCNIYVGDQRVAKSEELLSKLHIKRIVNCTHNIDNFHGEKFQYLRFPIGKWRQFNATEEQLLQFMQSYLSFIEEGIRKGENIFIHCLAGAHRAGTAGVIAIMHLTQMNHRQALKTARQLRPVIEPIGSL